MDVTAIANDAAAIDYLLNITGGVTGRIVEMIRLAARNALRCGKRNSRSRPFRQRQRDPRRSQFGVIFHLIVSLTQ